MFELEVLKQQVAELQSQIACILNGDCCDGGGGEVPNDDWVYIFENASGISAVTWQGSATSNATPLITVAYKITSPDSAIVKVKAFLDADIDAIGNSLNFRFTLAPIGVGNSQWFSGSKYFTTLFGSGATEDVFAVPVKITPAFDGVASGVLSPTLDQYQSKGRAFINNGLVIAQGLGPVLPEGHYQFLVEFEMTAQLLSV